MSKARIRPYKTHSAYGEGHQRPDLQIGMPTAEQVQGRLSGTTGMSQDQLFGKLCDDVGIIASTTVIERGLAPRLISVTTTPQRVVTGQFERGYIFLNPTAPVGLAASATIFASSTKAALATGNSQSAALGVASYRNLALFLDISATTGGTVQIDAQTQDPLSLNWVTVQSDIFNTGGGTPSSVGTYYANLGTVGVDLSFAAAYTIGAGGGSTFSLSAVTKDGLPGGGTGLANTIFLGSNDQVNQSSAYPLQEGKELKAYFRKNTEIWAVSLISGGVNLMIFELQ